jgi:hypothetical protein
MVLGPFCIGGILIPILRIFSICWGLICGILAPTSDFDVISHNPGFIEPAAQAVEQHMIDSRNSGIDFLYIVLLSLEIRACASPRNET